jgi:glycosyltransferase involved in cell wall biosynthesis
VVVLWDKVDGFKNDLKKNIKYYSVQYRRRTMPLGIFKLIKYFKENEIEIIHSHMYDPNKIATVAGNLANVPCIVTSEHGRNLWKKKRHHFVEKHLIDRFVKLRVAVSKDIKNLRIKNDKLNPNKIITIPNGVSIPDTISNKKKIPRVIGAMGRLDDAKDYFSLIDTMKIVRDAGSDLKLMIAGEGYLKAKLAKYINKLGLNKSVKLVGFQKSDLFLRKIDIFAMSSEREGMPVALLEAMSFGLPVVATNVGGIKEVVENNIDGLLSESKNPKAMAENIIRMVEDGNLRDRLGLAARNKVIKQYSIKIIADLYAKLYFKLYCCDKLLH